MACALLTRLKRWVWSEINRNDVGDVLRKVWRFRIISNHGQSQGQKDWSLINGLISPYASIFLNQIRTFYPTKLTSADCEKNCTSMVSVDVVTALFVGLTMSIIFIGRCRNDRNAGMWPLRQLPIKVQRSMFLFLYCRQTFLNTEKFNKLVDFLLFSPLRAQYTIRATKTVVHSTPVVGCIPWNIEIFYSGLASRPVLVYSKAICIERVINIIFVPFVQLLSIFFYWDFFSVRVTKS